MTNKILIGIQVVAGLMLIVFGLNKFLHFIPMGEPPAGMGEYLGALFKTGFIFPVIAVIEITAGVAFVSNKFAPLMVIILMPVIVNAFLAHLFLDPAGIGAAAFILTALIIIIVRNFGRYREIFKP